MHTPICIFQFCHSNSWPFTLKLTPSGWTTCSGLRSSLNLKFSSVLASSSGRKSKALRGGGIRSLWGKGLADSGGGAVDFAENIGPSGDAL
jgi:hypothetical protein